MGALGSRADGTALPILRAAHYQNVVRAIKHPDMSRHRDMFQKLSDGQTLEKDEIRELRNASRHPHFAGPVRESLGVAADLHEAARLSDEGAGGGRRAHSTKITSDDGLVGFSADGSALPLLRGEHYRNIRKASKHPDMLSRYPEVFQALLNGQTLGKDEVRDLRRAARHPDFAGSVSDSLVAAADLNEAAAADALGAPVKSGGRSPFSLKKTSAEIKRDIERVTGAPYPPRPSRR